MQSQFLIGAFAGNIELNSCFDGPSVSLPATTFRETR